MSDYRFQIVEHNGIPCLHVMIEVDEDNYDAEIQQTYIPIGDIQESIARFCGATSPEEEAERQPRIDQSLAAQYQRQAKE